MKRSREAQKERLLREAEAVIEELLAWEEGQPQPTFDEIEQEILELRQKLGQRMAELVLQNQAAERPSPGPLCPQCGREMRCKAQKPKQLESLLGPLEVKRGYYTCAQCGQRVFPPGSPTRPAR
jgi:uncharacterized protein with PIN domain